MDILRTNNDSSVSWASIFAGATIAAAMTLLLLILGFGLGFSVISPWEGEGLSMETIGVSTIVWLTITQILASGLGGYVAGRLRTRWVDIHVDESYFRDTAHGLISWAVATLIVATLVVSSVGAAITGTAKTGAAITTGAASATPVISNAISESSDYVSNALLRTETGQQMVERADDDIRNELSTIVVQSLQDGELNENDKQYVVSIVANYTNLNQQQAEQRVNEVIDRALAKASEAEQAARETMEEALSAATFASLWLFIALLIGAFMGSLMATIGGRQRDAIVH